MLSIHETIHFANAALPFFAAVALVGLAVFGYYAHREWGAPKKGDGDEGK